MPVSIASAQARLGGGGVSRARLRMILLFFQNVVAAVLDATANVFRLSAQVRQATLPDRARQAALPQRLRQAALPRRARTATLPARERSI
jgi:hypothetical protein